MGIGSYEAPTLYGLRSLCIISSSPAPLTPDKGGARVALDLTIACSLPSRVSEVSEKCHSYVSIYKTLY